MSVDKDPNRFLQAITAPQLTSSGEESIHVFLKKCEAYLRQVVESHDDAVQATTLLSSVDPDIVKDGVIMGLFPSAVTKVDDVTDELLKTYLEGTQANNPVLDGDQLLKEIRSRVRCNLSEADPELRILQMVSTYFTTIRELRMPDWYEDNPKLATEHLVELVQPSGLQTLLKSVRDLHYGSLKKDFSGFVSHMRPRAVAFEKYNGPPSKS